MRAVRGGLLGQKDGWWRVRGVRLKDIANHFNLAAQSVSARRPGAVAPTSTTSGCQGPGAPLEPPLEHRPKQRQRLERLVRAENAQEGAWNARKEVPA